MKGLIDFSAVHPIRGMKTLLFPQVICLFLALFPLGPAVACPEIGPFLDYNCDGKSKTVFTGDSIVYGRGDVLHHNSGGFVLRLEERHPETNMVNLGVPGITSLRLLQGFKRNLRKKETGTTKIKSRAADSFLILVGVNDWWDDIPPGMVVRNIKRLVKFLRTELDGPRDAPFIAVSTLLPTTRHGQDNYVAEVNRLLLKYRSAKKLPVYIRSDALQTRYLDETGLHPSPAGHDRMADIMESFLIGREPELMKKQRPDLDSDGVYDRYERSKFGTDPHRADTDSDGRLDGEEIFIIGSDPLNPQG